MRRWLLLAVLPLVVAATALSDEPDALLRQGHAAFEKDQPARAAELFERAGVLTQQPTLAAFNLATARYRQAREGNLSALGAAEVAYRCCLRDGDPYRARALYGLGNCLLLRATAGARLDRAALRSAIDRFSECLQSADDAALSDDARYNRMRARLLLLQAPPPAEGVSEDPPPGGDEPKDDNPPTAQPDRKQKGGAGGKEKAAPGGTSSGAEQSSQTKDGTPGPGKGVSLPPVSDENAPVPLAKEDAIEHVARAARKIVEESAAHRRGKARPAAPGVKDW